ncbi:MAG: PIN domain-containing protein [Candidatus Dojkabacteria bacterium]
MRSKRVIDTSFVSSLVVADDVNHQKAIKLYLDLKPGTALIAPRTVQLEALHVAERLDSHDSMVSFLKKLKVRWVDIDEGFMRKYAKFFKGKKANLKPIDSTIWFLATTIKANVLSFDRKLLRAVDAGFGK